MNPNKMTPEQFETRAKEFQTSVLEFFATFTTRCQEAAADPAKALTPGELIATRDTCSRLLGVLNEFEEHDVDFLASGPWRELHTALIELREGMNRRIAAQG